MPVLLGAWLLVLAPAVGGTTEITARVSGGAGVEKRSNSGAEVDKSNSTPADRRDPHKKGVRVNRGPVRAVELEETSDRTMIEATEILQGILKGVAEGDYELYTRHFSKPMKKAHNREDFLQLQKNLQRRLGKLKSMEYLGFYVQYGNTITLFKARFAKTRDDVLVKLVLAGKEPGSLVAGLWLDSPALAK